MKKRFGNNAFKNEADPNYDAANEFLIMNSSRECLRIVGKDGAFEADIRHIIQYIDNWAPDLVEQYDRLLDPIHRMVTDTTRIAYNMRLIRKTITPMSTCGAQYEEFEHLKGWTELVHNKCIEMATVDE